MNISLFTTTTQCPSTFSCSPRSTV